MKRQDFPGGPLVKNPPASAGDTGLIPGLGGFHGQLSPFAEQLTPTRPRACAPHIRGCAYTSQSQWQQEKPLQWEAHTPQQQTPSAAINKYLLKCRGSKETTEGPQCHHNDQHNSVQLNVRRGNIFMGWRKRVLHYRIYYLSWVGKKLEQGWAYSQGTLTAESLSHIFFLVGTIKWSRSFLRVW